jgi:predicted nucleic acid-binding protein
VARRAGLVDAVRDAGAFVADTALRIFRLERGGDRRLVETCDPLFELAERGVIGCLVSSISAAEVFVGAFRRNAAVVPIVDAYLRSPFVGVVAPDLEIATSAASLLARGTIGRLSDAFIAATALALGLPLVTNDRRLARSGAADTLLLADYA